MTQKFSSDKAPIFILYALFQIALISSAIAILIKSKLILSHSEIFCFPVMILSVILIIANIACFCSILYFCSTVKAIPKKNNKSLNIALSFFQIFLGLSFGISGVILAYLMFFKKISDKNTTIFGSIYFGIFAIAMIVTIISSFLSKIIGYHYIKKCKNDGRSAVEISQSKTIRFCNALDNIANILLSMNFYACHLFIDDKLQANKIYFREKSDKKLENLFKPANMEPHLEFFKKEYKTDLKNAKNLPNFMSKINFIAKPNSIEINSFQENKALLSFVIKSLTYRITLISNSIIHDEIKNKNDLEEKKEYIIRKLQDDSIEKTIEIEINQINNIPEKPAKAQFNFLGLYLPYLDLEMSSLL